MRHRVAAPYSSLESHTWVTQKPKTTRSCGVTHWTVRSRSGRPITRLTKASATRIASCASTAKKTPCTRTAWTSKTTIHRRWALPRAPNRRAADDAMIGAHASEGEPMAMGDIMTAPVVTVDIDDRLERVKEIF